MMKLVWSLVIVKNQQKGENGHYGVNIYILFKTYIGWGQNPLNH